MSQEETKKEVKGISGWLIVWLVFYLIFVLGTFLGAIQHSGIAQLILGAAFLLNLFLLYLFVSKNKLFPRLIIVFLPAFTILISVFDGKVDVIVLIGQLIGVSIWIFYFLKSVRVKNTFVN